MKTPLREFRLLVLLMGLVLFFHQVAAQEKPARIEVATVFAYPNSDPYDRANLFGFNHAPNVTILPDGNLMAAWFSGSHEGSIHQLILGSISRDGGKTWSEARALVDIPRKSDFDPAFLVDGATTWIFFVAGRWNRYPFVGLRDAERKEVGIDSFRLYSIHSEDNGATWSAPEMVIDRRLFSRANGITLRSGQMLVPVYDDSGGGKWVGGVLRSSDKGQTWQLGGLVGAAEGKAGGEPTIAELDDGDVLIAMRSRDGRVWFAQSPDAGDTWKAPYASGFEAAASSHALYRTKSGRILLAYDACKPPLRSPLVLRSLNQKTMQWGEPIEVADIVPPEAPFWSTQVAYPSIAELPDGTIVVVWSEVKTAPEEQCGKILSAQIRL